MPTITMQPCPKESTNVKEIGYDAAENRLAIRYANGRLYHYEGVPADVHADLLEAESIGRFIARNIRDQFKATPIDEPDPAT